MVEKLEEKKKKEIVMSRGPLRRLKSEMPALGDLKKRAHSFLPSKPNFTNMMKSGTSKKDKVVELKPLVKLYHPLINPVSPSGQISINGERRPTERGRSVPYAEKRYRIFSNTGAVSFMKNSPDNKIIERIIEEQSQSRSDFLNSRNLGTSSKVPLNSKEDSKPTESWNTKNSLDREEAKSEPGKVRVAKSVNSNIVVRNEANHNNSDTEINPLLDNKFDIDLDEKQENKSSSSRNPSENLAKGGIQLGDDGYYEGNIKSYPVQDFESKEMKQKLIKTRLMPTKCPSDGTETCSVNKSIDKEAVNEVDEDNYIINKKPKENKFKKQEPIETIHLLSSFNFWFPIELKATPRSEDDDSDLIYKFCDYLPSGKHYFYFIKNKKYFTLCKRYKIGRFKDCKNVWLNYIEIQPNNSKVPLRFEKVKKKQEFIDDDMRDFYILKSWKPEDEATLKKMFEADWNYTKMERIFKNNKKELGKVKKVLMKNYPRIKELFTEEAGLSNYPSISWNDFTSFCNTCQLVDKPLSLSTIDRIFIATNVTLHEYSNSASRDLTRYEFLEILVRIANEKYKNILEPHKGLQALLSDHVFKYK